MTNDAFDIEAYLKNLTQRPGVYQMLNASGTIIYVGKAKNLKKRVSSYFKKNHTDRKTLSMVLNIVRIQTIVTDTESEALILENTLIKKLKPKYNILFRDDKSYPYLFVSTTKAYPALGYHRGIKRLKGKYFGPFPNASAVHQTLQSLQRIFLVRQCADSVFNHRSRPCLQFQIKRCSGPCVEGYISKEDYREDVDHTLKFLAGKSFEVIETLGQKMQFASEQLEFETAGIYRDKISALRSIQNQHLLNQTSERDMDVIAVKQDSNQTCISLMMYRGGNLWGNQNTFPKIQHNTTDHDIIMAFIVHHYSDNTIPPTILIPSATDITDEESNDTIHSLNQWLTQKRTKISRIISPNQAHLINLLKLSLTNATAALKQHLNQRASQQDRVNALQEAIFLANPPEHMECFDISHTQGDHTVASCVVFINGIPDTNLYRKFNISGITPGDDYAAMHQVMMRRYSRLKKDNSPFPDLIIVDGGKGQLSQAVNVLKTLELESIPLVSVAKGEGRKAGLEILFTPHNMDGIDLEADDIALHLINHIRDESHRFAITSHRAKRQKAQTHSRLEDIPGIGGKTRQKLLIHFGGLPEVKNASITELQKVKGISQTIAEKIYDFFHGEI